MSCSSYLYKLHPAIGLLRTSSYRNSSRVVSLKHSYFIIPHCASYSQHFVNYLPSVSSLLKVVAYFQFDFLRAGSFVCFLLIFECYALTPNYLRFVSLLDQTQDPALTYDSHSRLLRLHPSLISIQWPLLTLESLYTPRRSCIPLFSLSTLVLSKLIRLITPGPPVTRIHETRTVRSWDLNTALARVICYPLSVSAPLRCLSFLMIAAFGFSLKSLKSHSLKISLYIYFLV